jgi:hypothetical protein
MFTHNIPQIKLSLGRLINTTMGSIDTVKKNTNTFLFILFIKTNKISLYIFVYNRKTYFCSIV